MRKVTDWEYVKLKYNEEFELTFNGEDCEGDKPIYNEDVALISNSRDYHAGEAEGISAHGRNETKLDQDTKIPCWLNVQLVVVLKLL